MSEKIRCFTEEGTAEFLKFIGRLRNGELQTVPRHLLHDPDSSSALTEFPDVEFRSFKNKFEIASYFYEKFYKFTPEKIDHNPGVWNWLSLFYFDNLCPENNGKRKALKEYFYVLPPTHDTFYFRHYYRHLLSGPYRIFRLHKELSEGLLSYPIYEHSDMLEQVASYQELITNQGVVEAITELYFQPKNGKPYEAKKGATDRKKPGNIRRFKDIINQLDLTFDVYSLHGQQIVELLPDEFMSWKQNH